MSTKGPAPAEFIERAKADPEGTLIALDVDGTISEIAPTPAEARVADPLRRTLRQVAQRYSLWFISGRDADVAREMVGVEEARYIGAHGLEVLDEQGLWPLFDASGSTATLDRLVAAVAAEVPEIEPHVERKRWSVAFHYRAFPASSGVADRLRSRIAAHMEPGLRLYEGKRVYEVLPDVQLDKGTALGWLMDTCRPRHVFAAGDDTTDVAMFCLLAKRRAANGIDSLCVAIVQQRETPHELMKVADHSVKRIAGLRDLLRQLVIEPS